MRVEKCSFCGGPVYPGHGTVYVRNDCRCFRFCRGKCRKFFLKNKNPRKFKWTKAYRAARNKDLVNDSSQVFEVRRNCPVKYNPELMAETLRGIRIIELIEQKRQEAHWERRMMAAQSLGTLEKLKNIEQNIELYSKVPEVQKEHAQIARTEIEAHRAELREQHRKKVEEEKERRNDD